MVSVAIFAFVMVIALGSLLAIVESDRKAQTLKTVINNLGSSMDSMSRAIRTGLNYHCGTGGTLTEPQNCTGTSQTYLTFRAAESSDPDEAPYAGAQMVFCRGTITPIACSPTGSTLLRSLNGGGTYSAIISPDVVIENLEFYVQGAERGDDVQPKVLILLSGYVEVSARQTSRFNLQTSVTQRIYDL